MPDIYVDTFSKTLFPGLRVAYMVLPDALVELFRAAQADLYREGHGMTHAALAELIESSTYAAPIWCMCVLCARRRALLAKLVHQDLGPHSLLAHASNAGLHLTVSHRPHRRARALAALVQVLPKCG